MNNEGIILVGGFHEIIELCEICSKPIIGIIDKNFQGTYWSYSIMGKDEDAPKIRRNHPKAKIFLSPDKPETRKRLAKYYSSIGYTFESLIHPNTIISTSTTIGPGTLIQGFVYVSSNTQIGSHVRINAAATIMHDVILGDYTTIGPRVVLLGKVKIETSSYIGANTTILPGVHIGKESIIGAGSVVTKDIDEGVVAFGNPVKIHRRIQRNNCGNANG